MNHLKIVQSEISVRKIIKKLNKIYKKRPEDLFKSVIIWYNFEQIKIKGFYLCPIINYKSTI